MAEKQVFSLDSAALLSNIEIEASAGTGKTYTLETIVCQLVEREGLDIREILLVTFTEKAAQELRERIRSKLRARYEESLRADNSPSGALHQERLLQAISYSHQASISTIDSFFASVLEQHPFECGLRAKPSQIDKTYNILLQPLLDILRRSDWPEEDKKRYELLCGLPYTKNFDEILSVLSKEQLLHFWLEHPGVQVFPGEKEYQALSAMQQSFDSQQGALYEAWQQLCAVPWHADAFNFKVARKSLIVAKGKAIIHDDMEFFFRALAEVKNFSQLCNLLWEKRPPQRNKDMPPPFIYVLHLLSDFGIQKNNSEEVLESLEEWVYFERIQLVDHFLQALGPFYDPIEPQKAIHLHCLAVQLVLKIRRELAPRLREELYQQGPRSFNLRAECLYQCLVTGEQGNKAELLAALRKRYRCILVDEFQDTSPIQWLILYEIFGHGKLQGKSTNGQAQRANNYIIVGDPKQSIYRFRGSSPQLYQVVQQGCDFHYRLDANYRSSAGLIDACNQIFQNIWPDTYFYPSACGQKPSPPPLLYKNGEEQSPFSFLEIPQLGEGQKLAGLCFDAIALQVAELLKGGYQLGQRSLLPRDIAILLSSNRDCQDMAKLLESFGIPAVLSETGDNLFASPYAKGLLFFTLALCHPRETEYSKRLLLSPLFRLELDLVLQLEAAGFFEQMIYQLLSWGEMADHGKLLEALSALFLYSREILKFIEAHISLPSALLKALQQRLSRDVYYRILSEEADSDQAFINLRHLVESLYQEQQRNGWDCQELCDFLAACIHEAAQEKQAAGNYNNAPEPLKELYSGSKRSADEQFQQRISFEGQAVQVMTIHKSKGLEFPVVFLLPKVTVAKNTSPKAPYLFLQAHPPEGGGEQSSVSATELIDFSHSSDSQLRDRGENSADLRRVYYVGLTRAVSKVFLPLPLHDFKSSVLSSLLLEQFGVAQAVLKSLNMWNGLESPLLMYALDTKKFPSPPVQALEELCSGPLFSKQQALTSPEELGMSAEELKNFMRGQILQIQIQAMQKQGLLSLGRPAGQSDGRAEPKTMQGPRIFPSAAEYQVQKRYPKVHSFTSFQGQLAAQQLRRGSELPNALSSPAQEESLSRGKLASVSEAISWTVGEDSIGGKQDREHDALAQGIDPNLEELSNEGQSLLSQQWHELRLSPGAELGSFLHEILETCDYQLIASLSCAELENSPIFFEECQLRSRRYFPRSWIKQAFPAVCKMVWHSLHSPLPAAVKTAKPSPQLRLCELPPEQRYHELEFLVHLPKAVQIELEQVLSSHKPSSLSASLQGRLECQAGYLKGFIDLLFEHEGRYYLLDWKSNIHLEAQEALSTSEEAAIKQALYGPQALAQIMEEHHYHLQYLLYLAVVYYYLHTQGRRFQQSFDYQQDFGACYYLFLRGIDAESPSAPGVFACKPDEELLQTLLKKLGLEL